MRARQVIDWGLGKHFSRMRMKSRCACVGVKGSTSPSARGMRRVGHEGFRISWLPLLQQSSSNSCYAMSLRVG